MFSLRAGEKKFLAIATIVALVFVVVVGTAVTLLTLSNDKDEIPYLQATTGRGALVHVEPTILCNIDLSNCKKGADGTFARRLPVQAGEKITVSLSRGIFDAPWSLTLEFLTPNGFEQLPSESVAPDEKYAFTITSTRERMLSNIEVRLPSARTDTSGAPITRGFWSINTLPANTPAPVAISNFTGSSSSSASTYVFPSGAPA